MTTNANIETTNTNTVAPKLTAIEKIKLNTEKKLAATRAKIAADLVATMNRKIKSAEKKGDARLEDLTRMEGNQLATALRVYEERCVEVKANFADRRAETQAAVDAEVAEIKRVFGSQNVDTLMNGHDDSEVELEDVDGEF